MSSKGSLRLGRCEGLSEESKRIIESSYSGQEISQVKRQLDDAEYFLVAKVNAGEVGVLAIKEKLKERSYLYIVCLAVLSEEFWEDTVLCLIQGAKAYAAELGFGEIHIVESRDPYIESLGRAGFEQLEERHILAIDLASIPPSQPKLQVAVKRIPGDIRLFVGAWNHIVGSGSAGDFPDFPPITDDYIEGKLRRDSGMNPEGWFIALHGDEPCGLITVSRDGDLGDLMVSKSHRRMGIGTALVSEVLKYLVEEGLRRATLHVRAENAEALKFYLNLGFTLCRRELDMLAGIPGRHLATSEV